MVMAARVKCSPRMMITRCQMFLRRAQDGFGRWRGGGSVVNDASGSDEDPAGHHAAGDVAAAPQCEVLAGLR